MSMAVEWCNESKTAIWFHFSKNWTWEEFWEAKVEADAMIETVDHRVYMLFDVRDANVPAQAITQGRSVVRRMHPRSMALLISANPFVAGLLGILNQVSPPSKTLFRLFKTYDDAMTFVQEQGSQV